MSYGNIEFPKANIVPDAKVGRLNESQVLTTAWQDDLGFAFHLLSDRYWYFEGRNLGITRAVSKLILGITTSNVEFSPVGTSLLESHMEHGDNIGRPVSCIGLIIRPYEAVGDPEVITTKIIQATNEQLEALGSPVHLPLDVERLQLDSPRPQL